MGPARAMLIRILAGEDVGPKDVAEARLVAVAVQGLHRPLPMDPAPLRALLARCAAFIGASTDKFAKSAIRKAIARLDEATC
jgi:hypothetical protein